MAESRRFDVFVSQAKCKNKNCYYRYITMIYRYIKTVCRYILAFIYITKHNYLSDPAINYNYKIDPIGGKSAVGKFRHPCRVNPAYLREGERSHGSCVAKGYLVSHNRDCAT